MASLGEEYPKEQERCRGLLLQYADIGAAGIPGSMIIKDVLRRADKAVVEGDTIGMIGLYHEMQGWE